MASQMACRPEPHWRSTPCAGISTGKPAARVAAYLFVLHPYLIGDKLLRNSNAELAALCVAPLALLGVLRLAGGKRGGALLLSAGLGLTTLYVLATELTKKYFYSRVENAIA